MFSNTPKIIGYFHVKITKQKMHSCVGIINNGGWLLRYISGLLALLKNFYHRPPPNVRNRGISFLINNRNFCCKLQITNDKNFRSKLTKDYQQFCFVLKLILQQWSSLWRSQLATKDQKQGGSRSVSLVHASFLASVEDRPAEDNCEVCKVALLAKEKEPWGVQTCSERSTNFNGGSQ